jgi:hypothetical protein
VLSAPRSGEDKLAMMAISKEILVKLLPAVASQDLLQVFVASSLVIGFCTCLLNTINL